jgi:hypothetical protein
VILATGTVTVVRGAQKIPATVGLPLRAGDTVESAALSHAQIHMTDDSIISLRPETTFRIREYAFEGKEPAQQRSFFDLVKGGMRTVTGLIRSRENYRVSTETVSIGIRGTHYWLVSCNQDCRNPDGSLGEDGDYGLVREGSVAITTSETKTGSVFGSDQIMHVASAPQVEREFSSDQVFRVARKTGQVQQLIGPPNFLFAPIGAVGATKPPVTPPAPRQDTATTLALTGQRGDIAGDTRVTSTVTNNTNFTFLNVKQQSATVAPALDPVLQAGSALTVQGPAAVLQPAATGTVFYRLTGPFNLPVTCSDPPCGPLVNGDITLGVNFTLQLAFVRVNAMDNEGGFVNIASPLASGGIPVTASGGQVTFNATFNRADFPENQGAFRCSDCAPGGGVGFFDKLTFSGTINGPSATVTVSATDADGSGSATGTLTQQTPPNNFAAAIATQRQPGGVDTYSAAYWDVEVDGSGRARIVAAGGTAGARIAKVGTANNTIVGSSPAAGNLVWGTWSAGGATITDSNYNTFTTMPGQVQPWITGSATSTLPTSLGSSVTYTPVGSIVNNNTGGMLNSASLTANFVSRTMAVSVNATNSQAGNTFQMNGTSGISPLNGRFSSGFSSVTCAGPCSGGTPDGSFAGFFAGPNAEGAGMAFSAGFGAGTGVTGVVGFKR